MVVVESGVVVDVVESGVEVDVVGSGVVVEVVESGVEVDVVVSTGSDDDVVVVSAGSDVDVVVVGSAAAALIGAKVVTAATASATATDRPVRFLIPVEPRRRSPPPYCYRTRSSSRRPFGQFLGKFWGIDGLLVTDGETTVTGRDRSVGSRRSGSAARRRHNRFGDRPWPYPEPMARLRIAGCQINTRVGDLDGNVARILDALRSAEEADCDLAVFPELAVTGYPPEDLLLKPGFIRDVQQAVEAVAAATGTCVAVFGFVDADRDLYNAAAVCAGGEVIGVYHKRELPNYAVFDELRYFARGPAAQQLYRVGGVTVGVSICEDSWNPNGPIADQADSGAELIVNLNASPYAAGKLGQRERMLATRAADASCALVYVNQVGGQDELVFDGASMVFDAEGLLLARAAQFREEVMICDVEVEPVYRKRLLDPRGRATDELLPVHEATATVRRPSDHTDPRPPAITPALHPDDEIYEALVTGTRDYLDKNGFSDVVIGLSGGIDSTIVAAIAVDALGPDRVHGVSMPSRYSSDHSRSDAEKLAVNLGIDYRTIAIEPAHAAFLDMLAPSFADRPADLTEENLQSRIRGMTLMALSNKFGWIVLATGNKSEMAVGYATLYGDTIGGYAVLKDVYKTKVYDLCRRRNLRAGYDLIPEATITKPPSAELRPDQRDDQSLPPYELLDPILEQYIEHDRTGAALIESGADPELVARVAWLVDNAEYKRRQTPPGVRVSVKAFGKDRRLPITNAYRFRVENG